MIEPARTFKALRFNTLVFDCDGVILDSNRLKTKAFEKVASKFGKTAAQQLTDFHVKNGGISRYRKFEYLIQNILGRPIDSDQVKLLVDEYAAEVRSQLLTCPACVGLRELKEKMPATSWMIVSGGDQQELRDVFSIRGLSDLFDLGIFGSPDTKDVILRREIDAGRLKLPSLFLGDSKYDHEAATRAGLDFIFISQWSEFNGWADYCKENKITALPSALDITSVSNA